MKYIIILFTVSVVAAILFASCSKSKNGVPSNPSSGKFVDVDEGSSGQTIHVLPGETIRVVLRSNPSTGFSWQLRPIEEEIIESIESGFEADPHKEYEAGYGGNHVWKFKAVGAGESELSLVYARPWEDEKPAKTFKMKIVVDAATPQIAVCYPEEEFKLTEKDNGKTIEVHTGDIIRIALESNITTGYDWENADKVDKDILKLEKNDYVSDPNPEELDGVGGKTVIVYRALKQGKAKIDLSYMQAWESDADDIEKFSVTVEVLDRP